MAFQKIKYILFNEIKLPSVSNILSDNASAEEDDEERDKVIEISLSDPTKVGDGMGSYMVYKITTKVIEFSRAFLNKKLTQINFFLDKHSSF